MRKFTRKKTYPRRPCTKHLQRTSVPKTTSPSCTNFPSISPFTCFLCCFLKPRPVSSSKSEPPPHHRPHCTQTSPPFVIRPKNFRLLQSILSPFLNPLLHKCTLLSSSPSFGKAPSSRLRWIPLASSPSHECQLPLRLLPLESLSCWRVAAPLQAAPSCQSNKQNM